MAPPVREDDVLELCRQLKLPTVGREALRLATEASRQQVSPLAYLVNVLSLELADREERRAARRIKAAGFPLPKTLESFDFQRAAHLPEARVRELATGTYLPRAEPILFLGESGTGKTHLATALGMAAAQAGHAVRFVTAAQVVTELIEARDAHDLNRLVGRYSRVEVLILDELGYLPLSRKGAAHPATPLPCLNQHLLLPNPQREHSNSSLRGKLKTLFMLGWGQIRSSQWGQCKLTNRLAPSRAVRQRSS